MSSSTVHSNRDLQALQSYVTAADSTQYSQLAETTLLLNLTHSNLKQQHIEIRFDKHNTVSTLRQRIFQKTGTSPAYQHLQILSPFGSYSSSSSSPPLAEIPPGETHDSYKLGYFPLENGYTVHCIDTNPCSESLNGNFEDTSLVEKYKMSDDNYDKRKGTLRDWGRTQKLHDETFSLAKHAKEHREKMEAMRQYKLGLALPAGWEVDASTSTVVRIEEDINDSVLSEQQQQQTNTTPGADTVENIQVGMRCQVQPGGRRGEVVFVGEVEELGSGGFWVGIKFDEPVGKADGSVPSGKRYFDVPPGYGGFCRGKNVETGDFPEIDIFADTDSEDEL